MTDTRRAGALLGFLHAAEDRDALEILAGLVRIDAGHETIPAVGVIAAQPGMECAGLAGDALGDHPGVPVDQDAHRARSYVAAADGGDDLLRRVRHVVGGYDRQSRRLQQLACRAPRSCPSCAPPGARRASLRLAAAITPSAMVSQRMMPPKMLTRMPLTAGFFSISLNASVTFCAVAPPPTSRKFAGSAPNSLIASMVAIASPAPFTETADVAVERDVRQVELRGLDLGGILLVEIAHGDDLGMAEQRVVVEIQLGVERQHLAVAGEDQRIDLGERGIAFDEGPVQAVHELARLRDASPAERRSCARPRRPARR